MRSEGAMRKMTAGPLSDWLEWPAGDGTEEKEVVLFRSSDYV